MEELIAKFMTYLMMGVPFFVIFLFIAVPYSIIKNGRKKEDARRLEAEKRKSAMGNYGPAFKK